LSLSWQRNGNKTSLFNTKRDNGLNQNPLSLFIALSLTFYQIVNMKINLYLDEKYDKIVSTFSGKIIVKLISEIVLACLIDAAVYGATTLYNQKSFR